MSDFETPGVPSRRAVAGRTTARRRAAAPLLALLFLAAGCDEVRNALPPLDLSPIGSSLGPAAPVPDPRRVSGRVVPQSGAPTSLTGGAADVPPPIARQIGESRPIAAPSSNRALPQGDFTLDYVDTDIREIVRVVLGSMLQVNYMIEPGVQGTATVQTGRPVPRDALLQVLAGALAQNGATLVNQDGVYRVTMLAANQTVFPVVPDGAPGSGAQVVPLRFASAQRLAQMLEPYAGQVSRVQADPARNAIVVTGSAAARENLIDLIRVFDVDYLASQSYALFPIRSGDARSVARDMQKILQTDANRGLVSILPIERTNAVLVISPQQGYVERAGRLVAQLDQAQLVAGRQLHVYFVQNGQASDLQPVLQRAFGATGSQNAPGSLAPNAEPAELGSPTQQGAATGQGNAGPQTAQRLGGTQIGGSQFGGSQFGGSQFGTPTRNAGAASSDPAAAAGEPPADPAETAADRGGAGGEGIRIIVDRKKNALLILATEAEYAAVEAALRRLDVLPLQVMIEATIAEVTLNDSLQYGTQYFLDSHHFFSGLTQAATASVINGSNVITGAAGFAGTLAPALPGVVVAGQVGSVQYALQALKSVTDVSVVSSPKLLILDNERARLQVGALVPVITQSATSVITAGSPVVNSVDYRETGVILSVRPRVNSGGLVTLDIDQEVSDVVNTTTSQIDSPTFQQRKIQSRIVVQDGQTVALAGLIQNNVSYGNSGIPLLKDIPGLGALFGSRSRSTARTELLLLITPRVVRGEDDARALTDELRRKLSPIGGVLSPLDPARAAPSPPPAPGGPPTS